LEHPEVRARSLSKRINEREIADFKKKSPAAVPGFPVQLPFPRKHFRALSPSEKAVSVARLGRQQATKQENSLRC
jgi:hypothetical protein